MERKRNDRDRFEKQIPFFRQEYTESYVIKEHSYVSGQVCIVKIRTVRLLTRKHLAIDDN